MKLQMSDMKKEDMKVDAQEDLEKLQRALKWFTVAEDKQKGLHCSRVLHD